MRLSPSRWPTPRAFRYRRYRGFVRRLVASARAYVSFVRANVAEYDIAERNRLPEFAATIP